MPVLIPPLPPPVPPPLSPHSRDLRKWRGPVTEQGGCLLQVLDSLGTLGSPVGHHPDTRPWRMQARHQACRADSGQGGRQGGRQEVHQAWPEDRRGLGVHQVDRQGVRQVDRQGQEQGHQGTPDHRGVRQAGRRGGHQGHVQVGRQGVRRVDRQDRQDHQGWGGRQGDRQELQAQGWGGRVDRQEVPAHHAAPQRQGWVDRQAVLQGWAARVDRGRQVHQQEARQDRGWVRLHRQDHRG